MTLREQRLVAIVAAIIFAALACYAASLFSISRERDEWITITKQQAKSGIEKRGGDVENLLNAVSPAASNTLREIVRD